MFEHCNIVIFSKVFKEWLEIAHIMRDEEFDEDQEDKIDLFDVKVKLCFWE
jgi:hypothetical protein